MDGPLASTYEFDEFRFDSRRQLLYSLRSGEMLSLTPKALGVLGQLVTRAGQVVDKATLLRAVWPNVIVEEANLTQTVHVLRRALGEHPDEHRFIVTVPGHGYRFVAEVKVKEAPDQPPKDGAVSPAVVRFAGVRVASRIGIAIAVPGILATSLFAVQSYREPAAESPVHALRGRSPSAQAHEDYLRANLLLGRRGSGDLQRASEAYRRAVQSDPGYAQAWAGLASAAYLQMFEGTLPRESALATIESAARQALALDPGLGEAHARLASYYEFTGQESLARLHLEKAKTSSPQSALMLARLAGEAADTGHFERAIELQRRAVSLDPLSATNLGNLAWYLVAAGHLDAAKTEFLKGLELRPSAGDAGMVGVILILQGDLDTALEFIESSAAGVDRDKNLALLYFALGRTSEADAALQRLTASYRASNPFLIAEVHAFRGNSAESFKWLDLTSRGIERSSLPCPNSALWEMRTSPLLASLHGDPRWRSWTATLEQQRKL